MNLTATNLDFSYEEKRIFRNLDLEIQEGSLTSIIGPNGAGKSTLVKCLRRLLSINSGVIYLNDRSLNEIYDQELARLMGYVPQQEEGGFSITTYEMILLGRKPYLKWKVGERDKIIIRQLLTKLKIEHLATRDVKTLSGGEKQKVAIARALAQEPEILFLDEPTASLDINHQIEVMKLLRSLVDCEETAVVVVLHDLNLAGRFSDRVLLMNNRGCCRGGKPEEILTPEILKQIYNIEVEIVDTRGGKYIVPLDTGK